MVKAYLMYKAVAMALGYVYAPEAAIRGETKESLTEASRKTHIVTARNDTVLSYNFNGSEERRERLQNLVGAVMQTPTGRKVLQEMADKDCVLMMEGIGLTAAGFFSPTHNAICLNSGMSDATLASTLVHEGTHALQSHRSGYSLSEKYDKASLFMIGRTMEADEVRAQTQFSFEAASAGMDAPWKSLCRQHPQITQTYERAVKEFGSQDPGTAQLTMKAWFSEKDYAVLYERQYAEAVKDVVDKAAPSELNGMFSVSVPTDSIVSKLCRPEDGRRYFGTDGKALATADTYYIHSSTKETLDEAESTFQKRTKAETGVQKSDNSYKAFYVTDSRGTASPPENTTVSTGSHSFRFYKTVTKTR